MAKLTQAELERHLWQAADILRGTVDAGDYKQYIFALLFYRRLCDVWDEEFEKLLAETGDREEAADPDEHRFHVPRDHRWDALRKRSIQIGQHLNNAFGAIEDANLRLKGIFGDVDFANQERFPDAQLEKLLAHFEKHRLRNADVPADMLGDAYMYLIKQFAEGSGKKGGEFYTPRQLVRLIVACLDPQPGMSIYDPTGGSGGMLLEAVQHLKEKGQDPKSLALYGQEKNLGTWAIAQINLFLHDIDDAFIAKGDTILNPKRYDPKAREFVDGLGAYDRVMANPPFSEKVWGYEVWSNGDYYGRDKYGCPPKGYGDFAFVQHMIASLKDDGMLGVVVPHGVLSRGGAEGRIRESMLKADIIEAVIGLAPNLFYGAGIPAAILVIRKNKPAERKGKVLIVNGDRTFQPGKAQNFLTDANVQMLATAFHDFADIDKLARVVTVPVLQANGSSLRVSAYVQTGEDQETADLEVELLRVQAAIKRRDELEDEFFNMLSQLDFDSPPDAEGWHELPLASLAKLSMGETILSKNLTGKGIPVFSANTDVKPWGYTDNNKRSLRRGAIVIGARGSIGFPRQPAFDEFTSTQTTIAVEPYEDRIDGTYLFQILTVTDLVALSAQQAIPMLTIGALGPCQIPVAPLNIQQRFAALLTLADDLISASRALTGDQSPNGLLQKLKRNIVDGLLTRRVRFIP